MYWTFTVLIVFVPIVYSVEIYKQCGSEGYTGATECDLPLQCFRRSRWFSSCQKGWNGATSCADYPCEPRSQWYSQCRPDCPKISVCSEISDEEIDEEELDDLELYNPEDFAEEEESADEFSDPPTVDLDAL
ncbi:unnamed protein product [Rotaria magnacalcarata]|uniref:CBM1 domain-containing protein n=1 Tax=Rotaria magnacalcarata TaxID=392030 RepID=A0A817B1J8_9BILA|nr:unnamed protein product [Rotaria magnacalcarata]CAF2272923.1 unnamed protein product [Rotaria magnacalcarata]CAF3887284.1 unnamed protein product [Rotaria magnacalcarata]CAF3983966.1 unnamed protein product [Rotaria magnacalcarata]